MSTATVELTDEMEELGESIEELVGAMRPLRTEERRLTIRVLRTECGGAEDDETLVALEDVRAALRDLNEDLASKRASMDALIERYAARKGAARG